jgi:ATP-dependent protease HslVU (ClpYQ) peptidase subunit
MTTIAIDYNSIASDSQATGDHILLGEVQKIYQVEEGTSKGIWAFAGHALNIMTIANIITSGRPLDNVDPESLDDVTAVWITPEGKTFLLEDSLNMMEVDVPFAIGSGATFAMGALLAGSSSTDAIQIASSLDPFTGKSIYRVDFEDAGIRLSSGVKKIPDDVQEKIANMSDDEIMHILAEKVKADEGRGDHSEGTTEEI